jgi:hypothetical protein
VTQFAGQTLEQLEEAHMKSRSDTVVLTALHRELLARKQRREAEGKVEKPRAAHLRAAIGNEISKSATVTNPISNPIGSPQCPTGRPSRPRRVATAPPLGFTPTDEQMAAVQAFRTGSNLKINAFAGSGKTSTLALLAQHAEGPGLYVAFNRACVADASSRFGSNVQCCTLHGLAFRALRGRFRTSKMVGKLNPNVVLSHVEVQPFESLGLKLSDNQMASLSLATLRRFAHSRHASIRDVRLPKQGVLANMHPSIEGELSAAVHDVVGAIWKRMCDPESAMPLGHDGYLKYWALQRPSLGCDYILLDEAQDTNDVVLGLLEHQTCQIVYVGDRHQQIYEWRGAINALNKVNTPQACLLTQSFRFGPRIAELANVVLRCLGERNAIVGNRTVVSEVRAAVSPDAVIARSNGAVLQAVMACLDGGGTPYVEGGTHELKRLIRGVYELRDHGFSTVPEFFGFSGWDEVVAYSETECGQELATFVRLVQAYGPGPLWHLIKRVAEHPEGADVTISTTHKAKGREWAAVRLEDDFVVAKTDEEGRAQDLASEEMRILYVALTRAKKLLQIGGQTSRFLGV